MEHLSGCAKAAFGEATEEAAAWYNRESTQDCSLRNQCSNSSKVPESDALQNGDGLFFEFPFGVVNGKTGHKRILTSEECERIRIARRRPSRESLGRAARERALEIRRRLESTPGLSRAAIAKELKVSRARVSQILRTVEPSAGQRL